MAAHGRSPWAARGGSPREVRRHNLGILLRHLHGSAPLSRAELTLRMGLNRSTIAGLVSQLAELGLVEEERPAGTQAGAGRPSLLVRIRPGGAHVLAVDLGIDRAVVGLIGLGGRVLARRGVRLEPSSSPSVVAVAVRRLVDALLQDRATCGGRVVGMGVALPAVVRRQDGFIRFAPNLGWTDQPLGELLAAQHVDVLHGHQVRVGNDADLGVLAEHLRGAAAGVNDVVFIMGGVGVGGGCIVGGVPLTGAGGYAGEVGHLPVVPDGRSCRCGARGCWETEVGEPAIARALGVRSGDADELGQALRRAATSAALDPVATHLGRGLAAVVNLFNPRLVIIGGLLGEVAAVTGNVVRRALDAGALAAPAEQVQLIRPELGADAVLVGASELAWEELLADPVSVMTGVPAI